MFNRFWLLVVCILFVGSVSAVPCPDGIISSECECGTLTRDVGYCCNLANNDPIWFDPTYDGCPDDTEYTYVDINDVECDDSDSGPGTEAVPYCSLRRASFGSVGTQTPNPSLAAQAGDVVLVKEGVYNDYVLGDDYNDPTYRPANSGTLGNPIIFKSYPGDQVDLTSDVAVIGVDSFFKNYIVWDGFRLYFACNPNCDICDPGECSWDGGYVVSVYGTSRTDPAFFVKGIKIINNEILGGYYPTNDNYNGIHFDSGVIDSLIRNNEIHGMQGEGHNSAGIQFYNAYNTVVEYNHIYDTQTGIYAKGGPSNNNTFRYNLIHDVYDGFYTSYSHADPYDLGNELLSSAYQNIIYDCVTGYGLSQGRDVINFDIYNNVFYGCSGSGINYQEVDLPGGRHGTSMENDIYNNLFSEMFNAIAVGGDNLGRFDSNYNNFYNYVRFNSYSTSPTGTGDLSWWQGFTGLDGGSTEDNPQFVNVPLYDTLPFFSQVYTMTLDEEMSGIYMRTTLTSATEDFSQLQVLKGFNIDLLSGGVALGCYNVDEDDYGPCENKVVYTVEGNKIILVTDETLIPGTEIDVLIRYSPSTQTRIYVEDNTKYNVGEIVEYDYKDIASDVVNKGSDSIGEYIDVDSPLYERAVSDKTLIYWETNTDFDEDFHLQSGSPVELLGMDYYDLDNDGQTNDRIPAGAYITGNEIIGLIDYTVSDAPQAPVCEATGGGTCYYVSPTGNDANDGSFDFPFRNVQTGIDAIGTPGDVLYIREGTYYEHVMRSSLAGTSQDPIKINGYPEEAAIIDGQHTGTPLSLDQSPSNLVLKDLTIKNGGGDGSGYDFSIVVWGADNLVFRNLDISGTVGPSDGTAGQLMIEDSNNILIENNVVHDGQFYTEAGANDPMNCGGIALNSHDYVSGSRNITIRDNLIYNMPVGTAIWQKHPGEGPVYEYNNIIHDTHLGATIRNSNTFFHHNFIYNVNGGIVTIGGRGAGYPSTYNNENSVISYNTFYDCGSDSLHYYVGKNLSLHHNVYLNCTGTGASSSDYRTYTVCHYGLECDGYEAAGAPEWASISSINSDNNCIFYSPSSVPFLRYDVNGASAPFGQYSIAEAQSLFGFEINSVFQDPQFISLDPASPYFLKPASGNACENMGYYAEAGEPQPPMSNCTLPYDYETCNCIDNAELFTTINAWYTDQVSIPQLMANIKTWKSCSDE